MYGYDYYDYGYDAAYGMGDATASIIFLVVYFLIYGLVFGIGIASYIMQAIAYMRIAKKRGIKNGWLAFIPVAESYLVGSVTSSYDKEQGIERNWGKILVVAFAIGYGIFFVAYMLFLVAMVVMAIIAEANSMETMPPQMALFMIIACVLMFVSMTGVLVQSVLRMICNFKNYEGMVPDKAIKYTVISVLVPLAGPILLLKCAKKIPDVNETEQTPLIEE